MYLMYPPPDIYDNDHSYFLFITNTLCLQGMMGLISQAFVHTKRHRRTHTSTNSAHI